MTWGLFVKGFVVGLSIAMPVGPVNIMVIRRSLSHGHLRGFVSGLGAAVADCIYGGMAALGLTVVADFVTRHQVLLRFFGGLIMIWLGFSWLRRAIQPSPALCEIEGEPEPAKPSAHPLWGAFASALVLTLTNPITIFAFVAIFAGLGLGTSGRDSMGALMIVLGVGAGSGLWWLILSSGVSLVRHRITPRATTFINRLAGVILMAFGLAALISLVFKQDI